MGGRVGESAAGRKGKFECFRDTLWQFPLARTSFSNTLAAAMKRLPHFLGVLLVATLLAGIGAGCTKYYQRIPLAELRQMQSFKAKVEGVMVEDLSAHGEGMVVFVSLKTEDGRRVSLGGERAKASMIEFIRSFEKGRTYEFPKVLLEFEQRTGLAVE
jgi:hypothetical protein